MIDSPRVTKITRILSYARPYWHQILGIMVLMVVSVILSLPQPIILKILIDNVLPMGNVQQLHLLLLILLGLYLLQNVVGFGQQYFASAVSQKLLIDIREEIFSHLLHLSPKFHQKNQTGDLMSRILQDASALQAAAITTPINLLTNIVTLIAILFIIIRINWQLALVSSVTVPGFLLTIWIFNRPIREASTRVLEEFATVNSQLQETLTSVNLIQAFANELFEQQRFTTRLEQLAKVQIHKDVVNLWGVVVGGLVVFLGPLIVLWYGGVEVARGALTIGSLIAFHAYLGKLYGPASGLVQMILGLQSSIAGIDRAFALLDSEPDIYERKHAHIVNDADGRIEFKSVSFNYDDGVFALKNISFVAEPGMQVGIVGPSGSGKSTLINLLCRYYDPVAGEISLDGKDLRHITVKSLRNQIGIVSQDTFLFDTSFRDNIAYGKIKATFAEIVESAKIAKIHDYIVSLPNGYDTRVGERGVKISGGQKQRIAIARAVLRNPRILILDEATSSLDSNVETSIHYALDPLMMTRTTFIVAHRLSTVKNADIILVLNYGRIVEQGSHYNLLKLGGLYSELYTKQFDDGVNIPSENGVSIAH